MKKVINYLLAVSLMLGLMTSVISCSETTTITTNRVTEEISEEMDEEVVISPLEPQSRLRVATTTSLYDTGLWSYLEPMFEKKYGVELDVMYAGTGTALEYGKRGDVDVITVHSKDREEQFIIDGWGIERIPFAYNHFLIVGPKSDPAGIKDLSPEEAFGELMQMGKGNFVSRGDDSGTHSKEKAIWASAGYGYETVQQAGAWYIEAGIGMGPTLMMANEKESYTLTDTGTYLAYKGKLELVPIVDNGGILMNVYSAIVITSSKNLDIANNFINFLISPEIQETIGRYDLDVYGMQLFTPCVGKEPN